MIGKKLKCNIDRCRRTDDDSLANMYDNTLKDVGTIRVEINRVQLGDSMRFEGYDAENLGYVHEKAKKAGAHCTRYHS